MRKLILLAGLPGTGKSYYAQSIKDENCHIISSDETRFAITHDYRVILEDMNIVYDKMIDKTNELLATNDNITIVLDSTFLDDKRRNYFLDKIRGADYIQLVMLKANIDTILARNHKRQTVEMIFVATVFGTLLAVPFYLLAASNITRSKAVNQLVRILVNIIRTIPTFVLAIIGAIFYGYSETAGVFAMTLFTFGIIFKLMYEYIETVDMNPFEVSISNGGTRLSAYALSIHPQVNPMFISNFIYTFEINIRASVVLGFVGAGGIGQLLSDAMEATQYDKIGAILIPLLVVVFVLQLVSTVTRRKAI